MAHKGQRVRCTREHMGVEVGAVGTVLQADDYVPGWDAGVFSVAPDSFPAASPYGHRAVNYWTETEMLDSWQILREES